VSESVEQAALRRSRETGWAGRARREGAVIVAEGGFPRTDYRSLSYSDLVTLCAIAWLQGVNFGEHRALENVGDAFDELRASL